MAIRTLFYRRAEGFDGHSVDNWFLVRNDDQSYWIEHSWSHGGDTSHPEVGAQTLSVAEVLLTVEDQAVLAGFKAAITHHVNRSADPH